jgi:hypothetical protein
MQEYGGGAGALKGGGDTASDVSGFAQSGDDQLSGMTQNRFDGRDQNVVILCHQARRRG